MRARSAAAAISGLVAGLGAALAAQATTVVLDYDAATSSDFQTAPYHEATTTTTVNAGHYEIVADPGGPSGDRAFQIDEQAFGLSQITITSSEGRRFDVVSLEVVNPSETAGEITIAAVGGGGGSVSAPTVAGPLAFGPGFQGVDALVITQHAPGAFAFDDLTLTLPEPAAPISLLAAGALLAGLRRRRSA